MSSSARRIRSTDPTVYPVEERVGEDLLQRWIIELLRPLMQRWLDQRGVRALVGADQFIYWQQHDPYKRIAPDLYVLPGVHPATHVQSWKVWEAGILPSFCLEVASRDWAKDYFEAPQTYDALGVKELLVYDPAWSRHPRGVQWQSFRRVGKRGLTRVEASNGDRIRSKALGVWLRVVGEGRAARLRLGTGAPGDDLVPTGEEAERAAKEVERAAKEAERAAKEAERAAKEEERTAKEAERAAKEKLAARVAELEAEIAQLRGAPTRRAKRSSR